MIGETRVEYGLVVLHNCLTLKFEQTPVRDSSGQVDQYDRFVIRVSGYFLGQENSTTFLTPKGTTRTAGDQMLLLRNDLVTRRQFFKMTVGYGGPSPTILLQCGPLGTNAANPNLPGASPADVTPLTDVNNGPIPEVISVQRIAGNASIRVEFEITIHKLRECPYVSGVGSGEGGTQRIHGVLSNRWSSADDIDENFFTTRTWVGELKLAHPLRNPHDFRTLCVPPVQPGTQRSAMKFKASEDGLTLQYTITDKEVYLTAPAPATSLMISHREAIAKDEVSVRTSLSVTVKGDRTAHKQVLTDLAMRIVDAKLRLSVLLPPGGALGERKAWIQSYELLDESGTIQENKIQVIVQLLQFPQEKAQPGAPAGPNGNGLFNRIVQDFGRKLDGTMIQNYVNTLSRGNRPGEVPLPHGPIPVVGSFVAHLQTPCTVDHSVDNGYPYNDRTAGIIHYSKVPLPVLPQIDGEVFPELQAMPDSTYSSSHGESIYQTYNIDSEYREMTTVCQVPISKSSGVPTSSYSSSSASNPQNTSAFIRVGPSQHQRIIRVVAERIGKPPKLPNPRPQFTDSDGNSNVLLNQLFLGCEPTRTPDGESLIYISRAEYRYGLAQVPKNIRFGVPDYEASDRRSPTNPDGEYFFSLASIYSSDHPLG